MPAQLELIADDPPGTRHALQGGEVLIGRGSSADLRIASPQVSRSHARVRLHGDAVDVEDLGSRNGTFLNGVRVTSRRSLEVGDRLQIGPTALRLGRRVEPSPSGGAQRVAFDVEQQSAVAIWNVGGNVDRSTTVVTDEPWDELFQGTAFGRICMAVGLLATITGFGLFVHFIFSGAFFPPAGIDPFDFDWNPFTDGRRFFGLPQPLVGFALFLGGGILAGLGSGASRASRRRRGEVVRPVTSHLPGTSR